MGADTFSEEDGETTDLPGAAGLLAAATLAGFAATAFTDGATATFAGALALGLDTGSMALTADLTGTLAGAFAADLGAALAAGLGAALTDLAAALGLAAAALDLGSSFPALAITLSLLVELADLFSLALWASGEAFDGLSCGVSSARECTGFAIGKPISCKIETIIPLPAMVQPFYIHPAVLFKPA